MPRIFSSMIHQRHRVSHRVNVGSSSTAVKYDNNKASKGYYSKEAACTMSYDNSPKVKGYHNRYPSDCTATTVGTSSCSSESLEEFSVRSIHESNRVEVPNSLHKRIPSSRGNLNVLGGINDVQDMDSKKTKGVRDLTTAAETTLKQQSKTNLAMLDTDWGQFVDLDKAPIYGVLNPPPSDILSARSHTSTRLQKGDRICTANSSKTYRRKYFAPSIERNIPSAKRRSPYQEPMVAVAGG